LGTGLAGIGATVRHASLRTKAGMLTGRTIADPRTAEEIVVAKVGVD